MEYIIVQAGGKGTRLGHLTQNKPKALLPVENLPMLFHLFRKYPDKRFIIIAEFRRYSRRRSGQGRSSESAAASAMS